MKVFYLTYHIPLLQDAPKIHTDLLWDLTWLFLILAVAYFGAVFYYRNRISAQAKKVGLRKTELSPMVSEFLFYEENATNDEKVKYIQLKVEIRQLIKDDFNRRVLCEVLLDLRKDVSGDTQKRLFNLYKNLGLHKDAYTKLKSWKWHVVSKGILELTQMQVAESYSLITKFINDKRSTIRKQAEIAAVTLKYEGINYFLDNTRFKISEWQQLKLLDVIRNFEDYQPPRFKAWLTSSNRNVVLFALRLIKYYNQNDASTSLLELVKHKNNRIKSEAINCIKEFYIVEASEILKTIFWKSTADIKILILDVLATFGQETDLDFLNLIERKESNFSVKSKALSAINAIKPESIMPTEGILDISEYEIPEDIVMKSEVKKEIDFEDALCEVPLMEQPDILSEESHEFTPIDEVIVTPMDKEGESSFLKDKVEMQENNEIDLDQIESKDIQKTEFDIMQVEVVFEEVLKVSTCEILDNALVDPKSKDFFIDDLKDIDLSFLPQVISEELQDESVDKTVIEKYEPNEAINNTDLLTIEVYYDEVPPISLEKIEELVLEDEKQDPVDQRISNESLEDLEIEKYCPSPSKTEHKVENIEVEFEELVSSLEQNLEASEKKAEEIMKSTYDMGETELDFLPIVVDHLEDYGKPLVNTSKYIPSNQISKPSLLQILDCDVQYDEVPHPLEETSTEVTSQDINQVSAEPFTLNDINPVSLLDIEVLFEEVSVVDKKEDVRKEIPKIEFYSEETLQTMSLLDDIEELGDDREIPLLLEYLEEAPEKDVRNRIREIIKKFAHWEPKPDAVMSKTAVQNISLEYNVLEELFRGVDLEEKLILLDAVGDIVDERDLPFLMKVKDHDEQTLRDRATVMIMELEKRLSLKPTEVAKILEKSASESDQDDSDIFKVDFEISISKENVGNSDDKSKVNNKENSFLEQLLTLPNKIIQSLNG